jgi:hypothetical protein
MLTLLNSSARGKLFTCGELSTTKMFSSKSTRPISVWLFIGCLTERLSWVNTRTAITTLPRSAATTQGTHTKPAQKVFSLHKKADHLAGCCAKPGCPSFAVFAKGGGGFAFWSDGPTLRKKREGWGTQQFRRNLRYCVFFLFSTCSSIHFKIRSATWLLFLSCMSMWLLPNWPYFGRCIMVASPLAAFS